MKLNEEKQMKKIIDFIDAENWYNTNKKNILMEYVPNENKSQHYFEFDDVVEEADIAGQTLSDSGSAYFYVNNKLYYVDVEVSVIPGYPSLFTPQAVYELEKGDEELKVLFAYLQQCEEVSTVGELSSTYSWIIDYITNNEDDFYDDFF